MTRHDKRGLPLTSNHDESVEAYEEALSLLHGFYDDPLAVIDAALNREPDFIMGLAFRASLFVTSSERRAVPELSATLSRARRALEAQPATARERGHIEAAEAWLEGNFEGSVDRYNRLLTEYPRDALALQVSHLGNFYLGRSAWLRDGIAGALPHYAKADTSYSYALGMYAFGLEECNEFVSAERAGYRALELNPRDPWAIHAIAHVYEMQGRPAEGIDLFESRIADWSKHNFFAVHNWWHLGLYYLDLGEYPRALELYDRRIGGTGSEVMLDLVDASSYLWRLELCGVDLGERWAKLADIWQRIEEEGYYAFNDLHALMAYAGAGRDNEVRRVLAGLERTLSEAGSNAELVRLVGIPSCRGFAAFAAADYQTAIEQLYRVRLGAQRFGGSNAQRDVLEWTLVEAAIRGGERGLARALVEARLARKPSSSTQYRSLARIFDTVGEPSLATRSRDTARSLAQEQRAAIAMISGRTAAE